MKRLQRIAKNVLICLLVFLQVSFYPALAYAQSTEDITEEQTAVDSGDSAVEPTESAVVSEPEEQLTEQEQAEPVTPSAESTETAGSSQSTTGPQEPTGPQESVGPTQPNGTASSTYTENPDGTWENDYYIWDPVTKQTRPKTSQEYSYNPATGLWDTTEWYYSPEQSKYVPNTISVAENPTLAVLASPSGNQGTISTTGPGSNNTIDFGGTTTGNFDLFFDATISNRIGQMSRSGDANVQGNTQAGNIQSGDAESIANILNLLQSSWGDLGSEDIATFVANVDGNVVGDLFIDPSQIQSNSGSTDIDINVDQNAQINNDVDISARSGDANVSDNTKTGSTRTGDARAIVNLLNLINSAISAKKSFVGVLNINGNLEGDILLPPGLIEAIIASTGPDSNNQISGQSNNSLDANLTSNRRINNDVNATATSGDTNVSGNTSSGNTNTGQARSNVTLLNLTGKRVVAKNAILVFVNVFGKWVGLILDAPAGSYAVAATGPGSTNTIIADSDRNVDLDIMENSEINNNVNASAQSGDANVSGNTSTGDTATGDADVSVNILNMIDSGFDISDWFGVLFINVFGSWYGSFGVDTPYGNPVAGNDNVAPPQQQSRGTGNSNSNPVAQVFSFIPGNSIAGSTGDNQVTAAAAIAPTGPTNVAQADTATPNGIPSNLSMIAAASQGRNLWLPILGVIASLILIFGERLITLVRRQP